MNVEIGTKAAQFSEKEYINGIFLAVYRCSLWPILRSLPGHNNHGGGGGYLKAPAALSLPLKSEGGRLSADSPDPAKKKGGRRPATKVEEEEMERGEGGMEGQPPKKRGKGKGKAVSSKGDATGPKRVFVCPHCQVRNFFFFQICLIFISSWRSPWSL